MDGLRVQKVDGDRSPPVRMAVAPMTGGGVVKGKG